MINAVIIGNGHYATGMTQLSGIRVTDKDLGVLLPSALALRAEGVIGNISVVGRNPAKLLQLEQKVASYAPSFGWESCITTFACNEEAGSLSLSEVLSAIEKPAVALIAVPDHHHLSVMQTCIANGIHFLVVKPALTHLDAFYDLVDQANRQGVFAMVDYHKVFDDMNLLLREEYRSGDYGRLFHASSLMTQRRDMLTIYGRWFAEAGNLNINHYLGSHYAHLVGYITGAEPVDVRAVAHFGIAQQLTGHCVADLVDMHIRWRDGLGHEFTSFHVSGWSDPPESESMTYQELHLLCEKGHIDSDQRFRGTRKIIEGKGYSVPNPYFFGLTRDVFGEVRLTGKYGYTSIRTFLDAVSRLLSQRVSLADLDGILPTLRESERITAILEAADRSLQEQSRVVRLVRLDDRYVLE